MTSCRRRWGCSSRTPACRCSLTTKASTCCTLRGPLSTRACLTGGPCRIQKPTKMSRYRFRGTAWTPTCWCVPARSTDCSRRCHSTVGGWPTTSPTAPPLSTRPLGNTEPSSTLTCTDSSPASDSTPRRPSTRYGPNVTTRLSPGTCVRCPMSRPSGSSCSCMPRGAAICKTRTS